MPLRRTDNTSVGGSLTGPARRGGEPTVPGADPPTQAARSARGRMHQAGSLTVPARRGGTNRAWRRPPNTGRAQRARPTAPSHGGWGHRASQLPTFRRVMFANRPLFVLDWGIPGSLLLRWGREGTGLDGKRPPWLESVTVQCGVSIRIFTRGGGGWCYAQALCDRGKNELEGAPYLQAPSETGPGGGSLGRQLAPWGRQASDSDLLGAARVTRGPEPRSHQNGRFGETLLFISPWFPLVTFHAGGIGDGVGQGRSKEVHLRGAAGWTNQPPTLTDSVQAGC